ncbi:NAD(P)/FAD-dependent oxidoreductase [Pacificibacter marinus]|uniref:Bifunctional tRNA (Mnm(5)s(2)U34)-methyltransferase/FAD-dependent cmnm(5)s(2)U34 oxidoreductase n=1 Tax=Pacificibacter marinus TaxID=658057 RepID=A0A1Y5S3W0_9RHOB|nr:FAD-binding oxidoreductase [Pacificibacter marinus]SEK91558.1 Glycine/D-amino acid oxidase [Pacificibacter marinus]SLN31612.1 bifunctional tRNA (mnm(5)s(2)U34)-methyltransferase/FAD-dependent cmnm(5)s(2)U34 oxidoreductase [Pacificibacter marinus]
MCSADITIYGAGAFGLSAAFEAQTRGAKVRVIDPNGVGFGSSGGIVGALAPHTPERWEPKKEFQLASLLMSREHWPRIEDISGVSTGYGNTGRLQAIPNDHQLDLARFRTGSAETLWKGLAEWRVVSAAEAGDWAPETPTGWLVHDTLSARINPARACASLAAAIIAQGGDIVADAQPEGKVIHATGAWGLYEMSKRLNREVGNGVKGQAILLAYDLPNAPQIFTGGVHIIPHNDGTLAIGSTSERYFENPQDTDTLADDLLARAIAAMPQLADAPVLKRWAGVRPRAYTRAPMMGADPDRREEFVFNGGFKIGFGMVPLAAKKLIDLVLEDRDTIPEDFKVERSLVGPAFS